MIFEGRDLIGRRITAFKDGFEFRRRVQKGDGVQIKREFVK